MLDGKKVLVTGGTGSLGQTLVRRLLSGELGKPAKIIVLSRDEAKQHDMRLRWKHNEYATDDVIYHNHEELLQFRIGDVRDYPAVAAVVRDVDVIFHAAAMKQVPTCEYFPYEAVMTNVIGAQNIVRALGEQEHNVEALIGISTDKACKPVNVMGMTKALQERVLLNSAMYLPNTRIMCARYGNVIASRGSVVPLFREQIRTGGPVTITDERMTRFLLTLDHAVDTVFEALRAGRSGEIFIRQAPAARVVDIAAAMIGDRKIKVVVNGIRPGEKLHEILVSEEECFRTCKRGDYYVIQPILPEVMTSTPEPGVLDGEFSSEQVTLDTSELREILGLLTPVTLVGIA